MGAECQDGVDNDGDGDIDLADADCVTATDTCVGRGLATRVNANILWKLMNPVNKILSNTINKSLIS